MMNGRSVRVRVLAIIFSLMIASTVAAAPPDHDRGVWFRDFERVVEKILKKFQKSFRLNTHEDAVIPPKP